MNQSDKPLRKYIILHYKGYTAHSRFYYDYLKTYYQRNLFQFSGFAQNFELSQSGVLL